MYKKIFLTFAFCTLQMFSSTITTLSSLSLSLAMLLVYFGGYAIFSNKKNFLYKYIHNIKRKFSLFSYVKSPIYKNVMSV